MTYCVEEKNVVALIERDLLLADQGAMGLLLTEIKEPALVVVQAPKSNQEPDLLIELSTN